MMTVGKKHNTFQGSRVFCLMNHKALTSSARRERTVLTLQRFPQKQIHLRTTPLSSITWVPLVNGSKKKNTTLFVLSGFKDATEWQQQWSRAIRCFFFPRPTLMFSELLRKAGNLWSNNGYVQTVHAWIWALGSKNTFKITNLTILMYKSTSSETRKRKKKTRE